MLPAAVLQAPFFDGNQPNYVNYGIMGMFIGHEITHAFTFEDNPLDENGSSKNWWTDSDSFQFSQRAACFMDHYDNFTTETEPNDEFEVSLYYIDRSEFLNYKVFKLRINLILAVWDFFYDLYVYDLW